ncbi:MAG TPA: alpha/beta hydrolase [Acidimicrobiales bacterium]
MPDDEAVTYPGARRPDRTRTVSASGVDIAVYEWGDESSRPLLLAHGGFDFAGTFDVFAPLLAAGGWRVVSWDHRGHGDSEHAALYSWDADIRDAVAVFDSVTREAVPVVGHSKGGALMLQLADAAPHRLRALVNIDGMPSPRPHPDVASHERTKLMRDEIGGWLDFRRGSAGAERKPGTIDDLARRRSRMNPRLSHEWLRYLVTVGARHDDDGWRWKIDPKLRMGGFGPWRNAWSIERLAGLGVPMLGMLGLVPEQMGWGTVPDELEPYLPPGGRVVPFEDTGHFVHIERPAEVAALVLEFLS